MNRTVSPYFAALLITVIGALAALAIIQATYLPEPAIADYGRIDTNSPNAVFPD
ncbi:MAG TPA: hypothetical protein VHO23_02480 [Candidatus Paceibacterota bacterium]|nr:hypothetical protein [Candidatus Paceibacterota bacterium]